MDEDVLTQADYELYQGTYIIKMEILHSSGNPYPVDYLFNMELRISCASVILTKPGVQSFVSSPPANYA